MTNEIKGIIFDYGNVLCEPQTAADLEQMAALLEMSAGEFHDRYWRDRIAYDRAAMDPPTYWTRVADRKLENGFVAKLTDLDNRSWLRPREAMLAPARKTRQIGLRIALLSNLPTPLRDALETDAPWLPQFDVRTYSCVLGVTKPDAAIYEKCVGDLGLQPSEVVFLDDRPENVKGANAVGLHAVHFESAAQALGELSSRYGVVL